MPGLELELIIWAIMILGSMELMMSMFRAILKMIMILPKTGGCGIIISSNLSDHHLFNHHSYIFILLSLLYVNII
jgi:hypothetical protein